MASGRSAPRAFVASGTIGGASIAGGASLRLGAIEDDDDRGRFGVAPAAYWAGGVAGASLRLAIDRSV